MRTWPPIRMKCFLIADCVCAFAVLCTAALAQAPAESATQSAPVVIDSVVAVVNQRIILASDLDDEIRLSVLDPNNVGMGALTRQRALEQIISRSLIEQQIRQEDELSVLPSKSEVDARLAEIRKELPACVHQSCATDAGWKAFLADHNLTPERVVAYMRYRLEILGFIEQRFRQGISIPQQEIADYYNKTLLPQYKPGDRIPSIEQVSPRIQEILLEQKVNLLFDDWLTNLRQQGDVEILDPALEMPGDAGTGGNGL